MSYLFHRAKIDVIDPREDLDVELHETEKELKHQIDRFIRMAEEFFVRVERNQKGHLEVTLRTDDKEKLFLFLCDHHQIEPTSRNAAWVVEQIKPNGIREIPFALGPNTTERVHEDIYKKYNIEGLSLIHI